MTSNYLVSDGAEKLADKLYKLGAQGEARLQKEVVKITLLGKGAIVDKITNDIEPHSGMHRKRNPQPIVTDLVDSGAYRASWQESFPQPFHGRVASNLEYALPLEYGTENRPGFYVARDVARKMREVFVSNLRKALKEMLQ